MSTIRATNHLPDSSTPSFTTNIRYPVCGLPRNPAHLKFLLLPPDKFDSGENARQLLKNLRVTFVALDEVVIRTFGGEFRSQSEKYDANVSESMLTKAPGAMDASSMGVVFGPLEPSIGREVESFKHYPVPAVDWQAIRKGQTPFGCRGSWGRSRPTFSKVETNVVWPVAPVTR